MRLRPCRKQPQKLAVIRQYMVAVSASLPFAAAGSAVSWPSPTLPRMLSGEAPVTLDTCEASWMVSLMYLGSLASALPAAHLADCIGRKKTLLYSGVLPIISGILLLLSANPVSLYAARFLAGLHIGVASTIQPIYINEISQVGVKETVLTLNNITTNAGSFFVLAVGPFVSFQTLAWFSLVLPFVFLLSFQSVPESPYFLIMIGNFEEARESLLWLRGDLNRIELEFELDQIEKLVETQIQNIGRYKDIFLNKKSRKVIFVSLVFSIMKQLSGFGVIIAYASVTLPDNTFGILTPSDCLIIIGGATMVSSLLAACFHNTLGRKRVMVGSYFVCSFSLTIVSVWFFLKSKTQNDLFPSVCFTPFLGYLTHAVAFNLACCPMGGWMKVGIFPDHLKTKASALSTVASATISFLLNRFYLVIGSFEGMYFNYALYAGSSFLAVLFTVCFVPETSGKTLQEIQEMFNGLEQSKTNFPAVPRTF